MRLAAESESPVAATIADSGTSVSASRTFTWYQSTVHALSSPVGTQASSSRLRRESIAARFLEISGVFVGSTPDARNFASALIPLAARFVASSRRVTLQQLEQRLRLRSASSRPQARHVGIGACSVLGCLPP